jgi:hypothetical protein
MEVMDIVIMVEIILGGINDMIKVLTIGSELKSAKELGLFCKTNFYDYVEDYDSDIMVRWGNSQLTYSCKSDIYRDFKNVVNPSKSIELNCSKNESIRKIAEVVTTPTIFDGFIPENKLGVIRPYHHTGGKDFRVVKGPFKINPAHYSTEFINTKHEFRVWFCGKETLIARRSTQNKKRLTEVYPIRSNWPYLFVSSKRPKLREQTLLAANKIGLECGAADVLSDEEKGIYYFLELNSAPTLDSQKVIDFFKLNLIKLIKAKFPNMKYE